jgi:hypothetical protein
MFRREAWDKSELSGWEPGGEGLIGEAGEEDEEMREDDLRGRAPDYFNNF